MNSLQLTLIVISFLIIVLIAFVLHSKKKKHQNESLHDDVDMHTLDEDESDEVDEIEYRVSREEVSEENDSSESRSDKDHFIIISIHARPHTTFSDYSFLQALGAAGLVYGDHKIFHYDVRTDIGTQRLFSVAQINKPGTFDIDNIEMLRCKGLLFFIDLRSCRKRVLALDCMLEAAYQLADDLDGIMYQHYDLPWNEDTPRLLAKQLEIYQKNSVSILDEVIN